MCDRTFLSARPRSALRFQGKLPSLKELPVKLPTTLGPIGIVTLKDRTLSPLARLFIEQIRAEAKQIAR